LPYTHTDFASAKDQLAALLQDTANVYWSDPELGVYIQEALRTWNPYASYWKERGAFNTVASTAFYDIPTQLSALRPYTVTDSSLVAIIQYHFLEPSTGTSWSGSNQFILSDVTAALQRRLNQFLVDTGCVVTKSTVAIAPVQSGRTPMADTVIDIRRLAWIDADGDYTILEREDETALAGYQIGWPQEPQTPYAYSVAVTPPLQVQLAPPPADTGQLEVISVDTGPTLDPAAGVILNIPDDFAWAVKWGAMADLLGSDGQARDPKRAAYCERRYQDGVHLARMATSVMRLTINAVPVEIVSLYELDQFSTEWQDTEDQPGLAAMAGLNLMALAPVPDAIYGVSADVLRNAPIPTADGDFIQIGREELDAILGYAQHLASFKMAGEEWKATMPGYERFLKLAMLKNERLRANAKDFTTLMDRAERQEKFSPRRGELVSQ